MSEEPEMPLLPPKADNDDELRFWRTNYMWDGEKDLVVSRLFSEDYVARMEKRIIEPDIFGARFLLFRWQDSHDGFTAVPVLVDELLSGAEVDVANWIDDRKLLTLQRYLKVPVEELPDYDIFNIRRLAASAREDLMDDLGLTNGQGRVLLDCYNDSLDIVDETIPIIEELREKGYILEEADMNSAISTFSQLSQLGVEGAKRLTESFKRDLSY